MLLDNGSILPSMVPNLRALHKPLHSDMITLPPIIFIFMLPKLGPRGGRFLESPPPKFGSRNSAEDSQTTMGVRFAKLVPSYQSPLLFLFPFAPKKILLNTLDLLHNSFRSRKSWKHENGYSLQDSLCKHKTPHEIQSPTGPFLDFVLNFISYRLPHSLA